MMRGAIGLIALVVIALPLFVRLSPVVIAAAAPAGLLCALAVATLVRSVATAGAIVAVVEYALAVSLASGTPDLAVALAFGVALMAFVVVLDFAARIHGAHVGPTVLASHVRYWIMLAGTGAAVTIVLVLAAVAISAIIVRLPFPAGTIIAAAGVALAALGVAAPLRTSRSTTQ